VKLLAIDSIKLPKMMPEVMPEMVPEMLPEVMPEMVPEMVSEMLPEMVHQFPVEEIVLFLGEKTLHMLVFWKTKNVRILTIKS